MLFYDFRLYLFLVVNVFWVESKETIIIRNSDEVKENIFNDVLKNISSANKLLQELIKNYEQLQNIYKTDEENAKSSDSDIESDNTFKASQTSKSNEINNYNTEATNNGVHGMTQMIFDDETTESNETPSLESYKNESEIIVVQSVEGKDLKINISEKFVELYDKTTSEESDEIEIITKKFNHTVNDILEKGKRNLKSKHPNRNKIGNKEKKRFSIKKSNLTRDAKRHFNAVSSRPSLRLRNGRGGKVKRIVYAEIFSPDRLWQEVVHKPISLKVFNDQQTGFRNSRSKKLTNKNIDSKKVKDDISDSKSEDEIIQQEQLKSYLLRKSYGDACLQLAVRKCYKALKAVVKTVCKLQSKCKSSIKSSFKENSKRGCIREFTNNNKSKTETVNEEDFNLDRRNGGTDTSRYIELCLPTMRIGTQTNTEKGNLRNETTEIKTIHILRDRFEKACKKLSAKKCTKACHYARDAACSTNLCGSKKKSFTKACKRECKQAYQVYKDSSDSDDDDDDEDSESESD